MSNLRFKRWDYTSDVAPSAVLTLKNPCGIYVLEFSDGEQYVGQSVNFPSRLADHRRTYPDIVAINFCPVPARELNMAEYGEIQRRRKAGILLRNKTLLAQPLGDSPLDALIDQQVQAKWLDVEATDEGEVEIGDRAVTAKKRNLSNKKFEELRKQPGWEDILRSLSAYVAYIIPYPHLTEKKIWTVTAMPSTNRSAIDRRVATLSINNVEMLFLRISRNSKGGTWRPCTTLNIADTYEPPAYMRGYTFRSSYRSAGPVKTILYPGDFAIDELLMEDSILLAARELALGQMRKGTTMFSKYHSDALADEIFRYIQEEIIEKGW
ncbi:GIY-YIG nuclease family protein [Corynebacterium accolens]|uniref:GIY-YIG nuclease family protein n=1 Tax=Corynebacterium accolens TaxID=38284 RepID=UPI002549D29C|nr:GIY-YIG nuclease family protein [Corynebacterium accolens]MDK8652483.1 GIY-YIG nuclease family protein [Corynebacterium accolens]